MRRILLVLALTLGLILSLGTAHAATCGGPWSGPFGTSCSFTATGGTLSFGGFSIAPNAAVGITVFSPPGVYAGGCSNTGAGFAACGGPTTTVIPPGQTVICVVKGLGSGAYSCTA